MREASRPGLDCGSASYAATRCDLFARRRFDGKKKAQGVAASG